MVLKKQILKEIEIPEGVEIEIVDHTFKVKGEKGSTERVLHSPNITIKKQDKKIILAPNVKKISKREKIMINTFTTHINNMIKGVKEKFIHKLKIHSSHFPMTVSMEGNKVIVKNFLGEKIPREAKILPNVTVKIDGEIIEVEGTNIEEVGQTAANIEKSTIVRGRDRRRFQDGIFITSKAGKPI